MLVSTGKQQFSRVFCGSRRFLGSILDFFAEMPINSLHRSGRGATWIARLLGVQEVGGSNPLAPTSLNKEPFGREVIGLSFFGFVFFYSKVIQ